MEQAPVGEAGQRVMAGDRLGLRLGRHARPHRLAQHERLADRRGEHAEAHAGGQHDEVHEAVPAGEAGGDLEEAEPLARDPETGADRHEAQELEELALSPGAFFHLKPSPAALRL